MKKYELLIDEETIESIDISDILGRKLSKNNLKDNGIYFLIKKDTIVYVGKTTRGLGRITHHSVNKEIDFDTFSYFKVGKYMIDEAEQFFLDKYRPKYNKQYKNGITIPKIIKDIKNLFGKTYKENEIQDIIKLLDIEKLSVISGIEYFHKEDARSIMKRIEDTLYDEEI